MKKNNIVSALILTLSMSALIFGGLFFITSNTFTSNVNNQTFVNVLDNSDGTKLPVYSGRSSGGTRNNASGSVMSNVNTINLFDSKAVAVAPNENTSLDLGGNVISPHKNSNVQSGNAGGISSGLLAVQAFGSARQTGGSYSPIGFGVLSSGSQSQDNTVSKQGGLLGGGGGVGLLDYDWWDETGDKNEFLGIAPIGDACGLLLILAMLYAVRRYFIK